MEKNSLLSREEEQELFREYNSIDTEDNKKKQIRDTIISYNIGLVYKIAFRYSAIDVDYRNDLVNEGTLGLLEAIKRFDYKRGCKFSTYAFFYIRQKINKYINDNISAIRLPQLVKEKIGKIYVDSIETLSEVVGVEIKSDMSFEEDFSDKDLRDTLFKVMEENLNENEKKIIKLRFGFFDGIIKSLDYAAKELNISSERVRQIQEDSLRKLRICILKSKYKIGEINGENWK